MVTLCRIQLTVEGLGTYIQSYIKGCLVMMHFSLRIYFSEKVAVTNFKARNFGNNFRRNVEWGFVCFCFLLAFTFLKQTFKNVLSIMVELFFFFNLVHYMAKKCIHQYRKKRCVVLLQYTPVSDDGLRWVRKYLGTN